MLRLGVYKLPSAEVAVIQTIIRLYAIDHEFSWRLVPVPPYDALLVDGAVGQDELPTCGAPDAVLRITQMHSGECPRSLERPIRADKLQRWLRTIERKLYEVGLNTNIPWNDVALEVEVSDSTCYRLRRWPSSLLLRHDADNVRMATLLSRRALTAGELAHHSQLPLSQCVLYLQTLKAADYLETRKDVGGRPLTSIEPIAPRPPLLVGDLIDRIRRRLGLGAR